MILAMHFISNKICLSYLKINSQMIGKNLYLINYISILSYTGLVLLCEYKIPGVIKEYQRSRMDVFKECSSHQPLICLKNSQAVVN